MHLFGLNCCMVQIKCRHIHSCFISNRFISNQSSEPNLLSNFQNRIIFSKHHYKITDIIKSFQTVHLLSINPIKYFYVYEDSQATNFNIKFDQYVNDKYFQVSNKRGGPLLIFQSPSDPLELIRTPTHPRPPIY